MHKRIPTLLGFFLVCITIWLLFTPTKFIRQGLDGLDDLGYDIQLRTSLIAHRRANSLAPVAIVDINDASLKAEGRWPWPRSKIAALVDKMKAQGAAVIAFDIFFSEKEENLVDLLLDRFKQKSVFNPALEEHLKGVESYFEEDQILAKSLAENQTVLAIGFLPRAEKANLLPPPLLKLTPELQGDLDVVTAQGYLSNIPILQNAAKGGGFINIFSDSDGVIRRAPLVMQYEGGLYPSLALQAVLLYLHQTISLSMPSYGVSHELEGITLGGYTIPTDLKGQVLIPFVGHSYTFPFYSATDVLHDRLPAGALAGKILFVGTSATGLGDLHSTAIENPFPGVEIQATLVNGMLQSWFPYRPGWALGAVLIVTILFGSVAAFSFPYLGPRMLSLIIIFFPPMVFFVNKWVWESTGLILSLLMPVLVVVLIALINMIYGYLFETRRREHLKEIFGQYVPAKHIDEMLKTQSGYAMRGETRDMSVIFADIRNFTTISETMTAEELVEMLNAFFTPMTEIIFKNQGTIDKYIGDLIMAFWGAPLTDPLHAQHAVQSALEMQAKVLALHQSFKEKNWPEIHIGIGINSGMISVGDMGSRYRRNYTVLGDAVNLASRVEGLTKYYGVHIIVTESTQQGQDKFIFRQLDRVRVKGKQTSVAIYEVIGFAADLSPELQQELAQYHAALTAYYEQRWEAASAAMTALHQQYPHTKIYRLYLDRIAEFTVTPPPADWDGVYTHLAK